MDLNEKSGSWYEPGMDITSWGLYARDIPFNGYHKTLEFFYKEEKVGELNTEEHFHIHLNLPQEEVVYLRPLDFINKDGKRILTALEVITQKEFDEKYSWNGGNNDILFPAYCNKKKEWMIKHSSANTYAFIKSVGGHVYGLKKTVAEYFRDIRELCGLAAKVNERAE